MHATALLLLASLAAVAPAPPPRPPRLPPPPAPSLPPRCAPCVIGSWLMFWGDARVPVAFASNGDYAVDWTDGQRWTGTWRHEPRLDGTACLHIEESSPLGGCCSWTVELEAGALRGKTGYTSFALEMRKGGRK